jgi:hypothetical protein
MEVNTMEEGKVNDIAGEEAMENMDYAKVKNMVMKPKKRVAGETRPELSSDEELRAQFRTERNHRKPKIFSNDGVKQSSNKNQK